MDLIYAFPLEIAFRFTGPEEYGSKMNRDIAAWMKEIAANYEESKDRISQEVMALCENFPIYE